MLRSPVVVVEHQASALTAWLQLAVTAIAASAAVAAILVSRQTARRDRNQLKRLERSRVIENRASRQAVKVHVTARYTDRALWGDDLVSGDGHTELLATVANDSDGPIRNVVIELAPPLGHSGTVGPEVPWTFGQPLDELAAAESTSEQGLVYVNMHAHGGQRPDPTVDVVFTDDAGDRWRLTAAGDVEMVHQREYRDA